MNTSNTNQQTTYRVSQNQGTSYYRPSQMNNTTTYQSNLRPSQYNGTTTYQGGSTQRISNNQGVTQSRYVGESRVIAENRLPTREVGVTRGNAYVTDIRQGQSYEVSRNTTVSENVRTNRLTPIEQRPSIQRRNVNKDVVVRRENAQVRERYVNQLKSLLRNLFLYTEK